MGGVTAGFYEKVKEKNIIYAFSDKFYPKIIIK